jgi:hypothetical protein
MLEYLHAAEAVAVAVVAKVAPWLAPVPTAWLVYDRTLRHFGWPAWVALAAALTVEALGVAVAVTALQLWAYNRERPRKGDPLAPMAVPLVLVALYFLAAELLTVALDLLPGLVALAPAVFPILSLAAMALLGVRADHARRVDAVAEVVAERKRARVEARAERTVTTAQSETMTAVQPAIVWSFADFARAATAQEIDPAAMTGQQVAELAGVSASTGRRWKRDWGNGRHV